jgi:hypothetical protein
VTFLEAVSTGSIDPQDPLFALNGVVVGNHLSVMFGVDWDRSIPHAQVDLGLSEF